MTQNKKWLGTLKRAVALQQSANFEEALGLYENILESNPNQPDALHLSGGIHCQTGSVQKGLALIRRAIEVRPQEPMYWINLIAMLLKAKMPLDAEKSCRKGLEVHSGNHELLCSLGVALFQTERLDQAQEIWRSILKSCPDHLATRTHLATLAQKSGRNLEARELFESILERDPQNANALNNYAVLEISEDHLEHAVELLSRAISVQPSQADYHRNQGHCLEKLGQSAEARKVYQRLAILDVGNPFWKLKASVSCPPIPASVRTISRWRKRMNKATDTISSIDLAHELQHLVSCRLEFPYHVAYQGSCNFELKSSYASKFKAKEVLQHTPHRPRPQIGMVVTAGHEGIFTKCTRGLLEQWTGKHADLHLFAPDLSKFGYLAERPSIRLESLSTSVAKAADQLRAANLDLLYFWEIGSDSLNYFLALQRLAPIQCTSWGSPETTGIKTVDAYILSRHWVREGTHERFSERIVSLDTLPIYFHPPKAPDHIDLTTLGVDLERPAYACVQNLFKLHPDFDDRIHELLSADPDGCIFLFEGKYDTWTRMLRERLAKRLGSNLSRVHFLPRMSLQAYFSFISQVPVLLDSLHFSGGNTSFEAFAMGTPIVTLPGDTIRSRFTFGCLSQMGLSEMAATSAADYVQKAIELNHNQRTHTDWCEAIRASNSKILQVEAAAREWEHTLSELAFEGRR